MTHLAILLKKNDGNSVPEPGVSGTIFKKKSSWNSAILSWNVLTSMVLEVWPPVNPTTPLTSSKSTPLVAVPSDTLNSTLEASLRYPLLSTVNIAVSPSLTLISFTRYLIVWSGFWIPPTNTILVSFNLVPSYTSSQV